MTKVIGIDNGNGGAISVITREYVESSHRDTVVMCDVPFIKINDKWKWDYKKICGIFKTFNDEDKFDLGILEYAQSMTRYGIKEGTVSSFNYGKNYGAYEMLLVSLDIHYKIIHPRVWQSYFKIKKPKGDLNYDTKKAASEIVEKLYPDLEIRTKIKTASTGRITGGKLLDGRVDAVLLALYGIEMLEVKEESK